MGRQQGLALRQRAAHGHRPGRPVVHVLDRRRGRAAHLLGRAQQIGVARQHRHRLAHLGLGEHVLIARRPHNVHPAGLPLVGHRPHAVRVLEGADDLQGLPLNRLSGEDEIPLNRIIHILNRPRGPTGHLFGGSLQIGIPGRHGEALAHLGLGEHILVARRTRNVHPASLPLVADGPQSIGIGQTADHREGLPLREDARDLEVACRCIVEVLDQGGGRTAQAFRSPASVHIAHHHRHALAHFILGQAIGFRAGPRDHDAIDEPLIRHRPHAIGIVQRTGHRQGLALERCALQGQGARRQPIEIGDHRRDIAVHLLQGATAIGVADAHAKLLSHILLGQDMADSRRPLDVHTRHLPLIAERAQSIGIGQIHRSGQGGGLARCPQQAHGARGRIVLIGNGRRGLAADGLIGASPIQITGPHRDVLAHIGLGQNIGAVECTRHIDAVALPLIKQHAHEVGIAQDVIDPQCLTLGGLPTDPDRTHRWIVDVFDRQGQGTAEGFRGAAPVHITDPHTHLRAHIGLRQGVGTGGRTGHIHIVTLPLVSEESQTIVIPDVLSHLEGLPLNHGPLNGHRPRR